MLPYHSALRAFVVVASHHRKAIPQDALRLCEEADPEGSLVKLLNHVDLETRLVQNASAAELTKLGEAFPALVRKRNGCWLIVVGLVGPAETSERAFVLDLEDEAAGVHERDLADIQREWGNLVVLCGPRKLEDASQQRFGFQWFVQEILKYRTHFRDIAIAAVAGSLLSFVSPLLFSVLIDRVIPHRTYQTLGVVVVIFVLTALFEGLFGYLRSSLTLLTTNRIDATLSSRVFEKMLTLPMSFFDSMPSGVVFRHLQQTSQVRQFLTGRLFNMALDMISLPILLVLLAFYSWQLMTVVFAFTLLIVGFIAFMLPLFRARLNEVFSAEGSRQAHSIETLHGIRTVKSLCLEHSKKTGWEEKVVNSVRKAGSVAGFGIACAFVTSFLEKTLQLTVLCMGALLVFNDQITLGALIAFNMLSNRVSGPLIQMAGLINEYQETALSVNMLAAVMNHPPEREPGVRGTKPEVVGRLDFDRVTFRYPNAAVAALDKVEFTVNPGEVIGVVGRSGSGKTTLTRLIQGIQIPTEGIIKLDGVDLRQIDLQHLRRNVGIVLQESFLFRGTIRENIAISNPHARTEDVVSAARMAGAEEFIDQLPLAYESMLEEGASNLSGGQRQRIAIARALLPQPKLLIFDEATSALDPESEAIIQQNLSDIAKGRSMIIVSHRLSSLVKSDRILVLDKGRIVAFAPHPELLETCEIYRRLWDQQTRDITG